MNLYQKIENQLRITHMPLWIIVISVLISIAIIQWFYRQIHCWRLMAKIPGPPSHPLFGHGILIFYLDRFKFKHGTYTLIFQMFNSITTIFGKEKLIKIWAGFSPVVLFFQPEAVEALLSNPSLTQKAGQYKFLVPWLGNGLLTSKTAKWKIKRKMLTPTFHFRVLQDYIPVFNQNALNIVKRANEFAFEFPKNDDYKSLDTKITKDFHEHPPSLDIVQMWSECTLEIICQTAMGVALNKSSEGKFYVKNLQKVTNVIFWRITRPWFWNEFLFSLTKESAEMKKSLKVLRDFTENVILNRKTYWANQFLNKNNNSQTEDVKTDTKQQVFLDMLVQKHLENPSAFTLDNVREEVDTIMFAGHDTTALTLSWACYLLGRYPEVQKKLYQEIDNELKEETDNEIPYFSIDSLKRMKYLECVLKETLRLYPAIPFIGRKLKEETQIVGYKIPKDTECMVMTYALHRSPLLYDHPAHFIPERFLNENGRNHHLYAFIPFSAGPRNCIGQKFSMYELKILLAHFVYNFEICSLDPEDKLIVVGELTLRPKLPIRIQLTKRNKQTKNEYC